MYEAPRHHGQRSWAVDREGQVRRAIQTLAQAFGVEERRPYWRGQSQQYPPAMEPVPEGRTKIVHNGSAKKTLPGYARVGAMEAATLRGSAVGECLAAASRAEPWQLEGLPDAAERSSRRGYQGAPMALARVVG